MMRCGSAPEFYDGDKWCVLRDYAKPPVEWRTSLQTVEEDAIRADMMAKLDIFGQLRKAKGEDWTPKAGESK